MHIGYILKGILLGFSIAAPVGPIGLLCIHRSLQYGRRSGFVSGLGATLADTLYAGLAAFGITLVSNFLIDHEAKIRLLGGLFLIFLGLKTMQDKSKDPVTVQDCHISLWKDFFSTFALTLTNPLTLLSFVAIFASLGLCDTTESTFNHFWLVIGVFLGSGCWWFLLSEGITLFRHKVREHHLRALNQVAGLLLVCFGLLVLFSITKLLT